MTERPTGQLASPPEPGAHSWDTAAIAGALGTPAEPRVDQVHGEGVRFRLGHPPGTELEIFAAAGVARVTGQDVQLTLFRQAAPTLAPEGVVFELPTGPGSRWLSISPQGAATLIYEPDPSRHEMPQDTPVPARRPMRRQDGDRPVLDDPAAPQEASQPLLPVPGEDEGQEQERVRLAGRLGTAVRYRETRNGVLIAAFPLGVKQDDGSTRWQDVLVFGERAEQLRAGAAPKRGQHTEVIGYVHRKEVRGKDGATRTVEEVYAVLVKAR